MSGLRVASDESGDTSEPERRFPGNKTDKMRRKLSGGYFFLFCLVGLFFFLQTAKGGLWVVGGWKSGSSGFDAMWFVSGFTLVR